MAQVHKRAAAKRDLIQHFVHLAENAGMETAESFLLQADATFADLARHPEMGSTLAIGRPELAGIRRWQVKSFEKFLIFYLPRTNGISIVRVLHAARDWWTLFSIV